MPDGDSAHEDTHARLRADNELWNALPFVGIQCDLHDSEVVELRNCGCGSTLGRLIRRTIMTFQVYKDKTGEFRWRLLASNGQNMASSGEGYTRREDAHRALVALQASIPVATIVDDA